MIAKTQSDFKPLAALCNIWRRSGKKMVSALLLCATCAAVGAAPSNDNFEAPAVLFGTDDVVIAATNVGASEQIGEPTHADESAKRSVWWFWSAPATGEALLETAGIRFDARVVVYVGKALGSLREVARGTTSSLTSLVRFQAEAGKEYYIVVDGVRGAVGVVNFTLHLATGPEFLVQPQSQSIYSTQTAWLTADAAGRPAMSYQWFLNGSPLADRTNAMLELREVSSSDAGNYLVRVNNPSGSRDSQIAVLTVRPVIDLPTALDTPGRSWQTQGWAPWFGQREMAHDGVDAARIGGLREAGASTLETEVTGPLRILFWWKISAGIADSISFKVDGVTRMSISGMADWQLSPPVEVGPGAHRLRWDFLNEVSSSGGENAAWLDEIQILGIEPTILTPPQSVTNCFGSSIILNVQAQGTPPLAFQWTRNGVELVGQTNSTLRLESLDAGRTGEYAVRVSNSVGSTSSLSARVVARASGQYTTEEALDLISGVTVVSGSSPSWMGQDCETHDQQDAARSGVIGHGANSSLAIDLEGPGTVAFWWRVSSEADHDFLRLVLDGTELWRISGERAWESRAVNVPAGVHRLEWRYQKDGSGAFGQDAGWVDQVSFTQEVPRVSLPGDLQVCAGAPLELTALASGFPPLTYQWQTNGVEVSGQTNATLRILNAQNSLSGRVRVTVRNASGGASAEVSVVVRRCIDLGEAVDAPGLTWSTGGAINWTGQDEETHDGVDAARSSDLPPDSVSSLETLVTGPGTLTFWWKLKADFFDQLEFQTDGATRSTIRGSSDTDAWRSYTNLISDGEHVLLWNYRRHRWSNDDDNDAWVDEVVYEPLQLAPRITAQPVALETVCAGSRVESSVTATGTPPLHYQWRKDGVDVMGATNASLVLANVVVADAGNYTVRVSNGLGATDSAVAVLIVKASTGIALNEATDQLALTFTTGGAAGWEGQACETHDGADAARTGDLPAGSVSSLEARINGPGTLSFWWKLKAGFFDQLDFQVDGVGAATIRGSSDTDAWRAYTNRISDGEHLVRWTYRRHQWSNSAQNAAWVDEVKYEPLRLAPQITVHPVALQTVCAGSRVESSVTATGTPPLSYQWLKDGVEVIGATHASLVLTNVVVADAGNYIVRVSNGLGETDSTAIMLVVKANAGIALSEATDQLALSFTTGGTRGWVGQACETHDGVDAARSGTIGNSQESWMETTVEGPGTLRFWWRADSEACCDTLSFSLNGTQLREAPQRWVAEEISLLAGRQVLRWKYRKDGSTSRSLDAAWVDEVVFARAAGPPQILENPESLAMCEHATAAWGVFASGMAPLRYQWRKDGVDVMGATNASLVLTNVVVADAGNYTVRVSNGLGATNSAAAVLIVKASTGIALNEATDQLALTFTTGGAAGWVGQACETHDGVDAARSGTIGDSQESWMETTVEGPGTLRFWWRADSESCCDKLSFSLNGTQLREAPQQWVAEEISLPAGVQGLRWRYRKDGSISHFLDAAWVDEVVYEPSQLALQITAQPIALRTVCAGSRVESSVTAIGTPPLHYQWRKDGVDVMGATHASLILTNVVVGDAGNYTVRVNNDLGSTNSTAAVLMVKASTGIALDEATDQLALTFTTGGTTGWVGQACETHDGVDAARSGTIGDSQESWMETTVEGPGTLRFWWKAEAEQNVDRLELLVTGTPRLTAPSTWRQETLVVADGPAVLRWRYQKDSSISRSPDAGWVDEVTYVRSESAPKIPPGEPANTIVCVGENLFLEPMASGHPEPQFQWFFNGTLVPAQTNRVLTITNASSVHTGDYELVATNLLGSATSRTAHVTVRSCVSLPVALDTDRANWTHWTTGGNANWMGQTEINKDGVDAAQSGTIGDSQESWMETTVEGPGTLRFWWRADSESCCDKLNFLLNGTQLKEAPQRWVAEEISLPAGLQVLRWKYRKDGSVSRLPDSAWVDQVSFTQQAIAPRITRHPESQVTNPGGTVEFSVVAEGIPGPSYQWRFNGTDLPGATNSTLRILGTTEAELGNYLVVVSNSAGIAYSQTAALAFGGILTGLVRDATNFRPIGGAIVSAGGVTTISGTNGDYTLFGVPAGGLQADFEASKVRVKVLELVTFTSLAKETATELSAAASGFTRWTKPLDLPDGGTVREPIDMSPELAGGMRLVLNWRANPADLDAHLRTPRIGDECFEIYHLPAYLGERSTAPYSTLDVDVRTGFGPETITLHRLQSGTYRYFVKEVEGSGGLAGSEAQVKIYRPDHAVLTITAPSMGEGLFWHACDIDGVTREVTVINRIQTEDPGWTCNDSTRLMDAERSGGSRIGVHDVSPGLIYFWDFGDDDRSGAVNPTHAYTRPGTYTVTLIVTNALGQSATQSRTNYIHVGNSNPSILPPENLVLSEDDPPQAVEFSVGDIETAAELLQVSASSGNPVLIPAETLSVEGNGAVRLLRFRLSANEYGHAAITLVVRDGDGLSSTNSFEVLVLSINDPPIAVADAGQTSEDTLLRLDGASLLANDSAGPGNEAGEILKLTGVSSASRLGGIVSLEGSTVLYRPPANFFGMDSFSYTITDDGQSRDHQDPRTATATATIAVSPVNDAPSFVKGADVTVREDSGSVVVSGWATQMLPGPMNESGQNLHFDVTNDNDGLFGVAPRIGPEGSLTFTPTADAFGLANVDVVLRDDGGTANGGLDSSVTQKFKIIVQPVNDPPKIALSSPSSGREFGLGTLISLAASASDMDGSVARVEFFSDDVKIGEDRTAPYAFTWNSASAGDHILTAKATDNESATTLSAAVHLTVKSVANTAPTVRWVTPTDGQIFTVGNEITITAEANDDEGPVTKVEFYREGNVRLGDFVRAPYQLVVADLAEGPHTLTAVATDNQGATNSVAVEIDVVGEPRDVAIIQASPDADFEPLTEYVSEVHLPGQTDGLTWRRFTRSALNFEVLYRYRLVIWDEPAATRPVSAEEVALLHRLHEVGIPIYFLGPKLSSATDSLPAEEQNQWRTLVGLQKLVGSASGCPLDLAEKERPNPILDGTYGVVETFCVEAAVENAQAVTGTSVVVKLGGSDVVVTYPSVDAQDSGPTRTLTQTIPLVSSGDTTSVIQRKLVFKNAVCWLLDCLRCAVISLRVVEDDTRYDPNPARTGELLKWRPVLSDTAECPATGVKAEIHLAAGLQFIAAATPQGEVSETNGIVTFRLGRLGVGQPVEVELTLRPLVPGPQTNFFEFHANGLDSRSGVVFSSEIVFSVEGDPVPVLSIERIGPDQVLLKPVAHYLLERSSEVEGVGSLRWTTVGVVALPAKEINPPVSSGTAPAFYRVNVVNNPVPLLSIDGLKSDRVLLKVMAPPESSYLLERSSEAAGVGALHWTTVSNFAFPAKVISEPVSPGTAPTLYRLRKQP